MTRIARVLPLLLLLAVPWLAGRAQEPAPSAAADEPGAAGQAEEERILQLIATLEDDGRREELIGQLRLLLRAEEAVSPAEEERSSVGNRMLGEVARQFVALGEAVDAVLATPDSIGDMASWLEADVGTESGRKRWQDILRTAGACLAVAILAFLAVTIPLRRAGRRLSPPGQTPLGRLARRVAAFVVDAAPILAFAAAGSAALAALEKGVAARLITADLLSVLTISLIACALVRVVTRPRRPALRLLPVSDGVARDINRRMFGIIVVMSAAYAVTETLPLIGMPWSARQTVLTIAALASAVMLVLAIVRHRRPVQQAIERAGRRSSILGDFLHWFAGIWHVAGIAVVVLLLVTYIVGGDGLFLEVIGQLAVSALVLTICYGLWRLVLAYVEHERRRARTTTGQPEGDIVRESGGLLLRLFARLVLAAVAIGLLVQIWLFDVADWLGNDAGRDLLEAALTIAIILVLAYAANRAIIMVIHRIQLSGRGPAAQRRRRLETLLPLLRSAAAVIIIAVTILIVLSEIGLDIAPLLASAGVVGIAIGFGAQSLVKDVITGLFFLVEDAFGVGDVVNVAGYGGVVEELSIRSIKLRDFGGQLHVIPFGVVTAATNLTRDFGFAVFEVNVAYDSDVDEVVQTLRDVDQELRTDRELAAGILEPIEIVGLDKFSETGILIKARIKTRPAKQWGVMRAYNRLLKIKFDERGIEIPSPQRLMRMIQPRKPDEA